MCFRVKLRSDINLEIMKLFVAIYDILSFCHIKNFFTTKSGKIILTLHITRNLLIRLCTCYTLIHYTLNTIEKKNIFLQKSYEFTRS